MSLPAKPQRTVLSSLHAWRWALLAALGAGIIITLVSEHFYREARENAQDNLAIIAELKAHEIERWLDDKRSSMLQPASNALVTAFTDWQQAGPGSPQEAVVLSRMAFYLKRHPETSRIALYDAQGHFALSTDGHTPTLPAPLDVKQSALQAVPQAQLIDFYRDASDAPRVAFAVPLALAIPGGEQLIGFMLLEVDPQRYLYPFTMTWPGASSSGETLLVRRVGDEIEYINPLRHDSAAPLSKRAPLNDPHLLASQFELNGKSLAAGVDYRQATVLGATHPVKNSGWRVIAKMDEAEIYATARRSSLSFGALLLIVLASLMRVMQYTRKRAIDNAVTTQKMQDSVALQQREEDLRRLTDNLPSSFLYQVVQDADGTRRFVYVSSGVERIFGISPEALRADIRQLLQRIDPVQLPAVREEQDAAILNDFHMDIHVRRADNTWGWVNMRSRRRPGTDENGNITWDGVATDVTPTRESEALLNLQARRASALLELPVLAEQLDEAAFLAHTQDVAEQLTGSQIAFIHFVHEDQERIEIAAWSQNTLAHYCTATFDKHYPVSEAGIWADSIRQKKSIVINDYASADNKRGLPEGHSHLQRLISVPVLDGGLVRLVAGVGNKAEDYTETDVESVQLIANEAWRIVRKQRAEHALAQTMQVIEASPAVCFRWRAEEGWPLDFVSDNVRRWGYTPSDLLAAHPAFVSIVHPEDLSRAAKEARTYLSRGLREYTQEYRLFTAEGQTLWVSSLITVTLDANGQPKFFDGVITDISERKLHEIQLTASLTLQQALNRKLEDAHNQLLQAEKLAAIGQLAAGVAHELNNPIGFVHSNLGTLNEYVAALVSLCDTYTKLLDDTQPDLPQLAEIRRIKQDQDYNYLRSDIFPLLDESREGLSRVRKIVQDLRDFSRTGNQDWALANLHKGLDSTLNIVANELKYKCTVKKEYAELPEVFCVISQINQVFMNLLVNAAQAIETTGEIVLRSGLEGADQVWISITDSGHGIPPEVLNRIFEPFFTTKPVGVGTGLGLSLVFGIINRHHGRIDVSSEPGQGTTFRIVLPIRQPEPPEAS